MLKRYIQDYKVHVFPIADFPEERLDVFQSDFRIVAEYFVKSKKYKEYQPGEAVIKHVDEVLKLMELGLPREQVCERLMKKYQLTEEQANKYLENCPA